MNFGFVLDILNSPSECKNTYLKSLIFFKSSNLKRKKENYKKILHYNLAEVTIKNKTYYTYKLKPYLSEIYIPRNHNIFRIFYPLYGKKND